MSNRKIAALGLVANGPRNIRTGKSYEPYFNVGLLKGIKPVIMDLGDTYATIREMAKIVGNTLSDTKKIAPVLQGESLYQTCKNIFNFLYWHHQYKIDDSGYEELRRPLESWRDRVNGIDCDDYATFAGSILTNLKIPYAFRKAKYKGDWQHVYVVVPKNGSKSDLEKRNSYYVIDPVVDSFNYEVPFSEKHDQFNPAKSGLSGVLGNIDQQQSMTQTQAVAANALQAVPVVGNILSSLVSSLNFKGTVKMDVRFEYSSEAEKKRATDDLRNTLHNMPGAIRDRGMGEPIVVAVELIEKFGYITPNANRNKMFLVRGELKPSTWRYYIQDPTRYGDQVAQFDINALRAVYDKELKNYVTLWSGLKSYERKVELAKKAGNPIPPMPTQLQALLAQQPGAITTLPTGELTTTLTSSTLLNAKIPDFSSTISSLDTATGNFMSPTQITAAQQQLQQQQQQEAAIKAENQKKTNNYMMIGGAALAAFMILGGTGGGGLLGVPETKKKPVKRKAKSKKVRTITL